jgi:hypothetical protein
MMLTTGLDSSTKYLGKILTVSFLYEALSQRGPMDDEQKRRNRRAALTLSRPFDLICSAIAPTSAHQFTFWEFALEMFVSDLYTERWS